MALKALIFTLLLSTTAQACKWSTITRNEDGSYRYPRLCHIEVGKSLTRLDLTEQKLQLTEQKLEYTFKQLDLEHRRAEMWSSLSADSDKKIQQLEKERYFWAAGGVLLTIVTIYLGGLVL